VKEVVSVRLPDKTASWISLLMVVLVVLLAAYLIIFMAIGVATARQPAPPMPDTVKLMLEDQFDRKTDLATLRGQVVILVYGDRKATELCRTVGESLHLCWHPAAKGLPPARAHAVPVVPLEDLKPGQASPNVVVVPVACCGKVPGAIRPPIRSQIAKGAPDVVVWLDFADTLKGMFGQTAGEPNLVVIDALGRFRWKINGTPDQAAMDKLVKVVQDLRYEAVK
jgi:hypothetical protein